MKKKKEILCSNPAKCMMCGKPLRYSFEIQSGICESCEIGKKYNIKKFEDFCNEKRNNKNDN